MVLQLELNILVEIKCDYSSSQAQSSWTFRKYPTSTLELNVDPSTCDRNGHKHSCFAQQRSVCSHETAQRSFFQHRQLALVASLQTCLHVSWYKRWRSLSSQSCFHSWRRSLKALWNTERSLWMMSTKAPWPHDTTTAPTVILPRSPKWSCWCFLLHNASCCRHTLSSLRSRQFQVFIPLFTSWVYTLMVGFKKQFVLHAEVPQQRKQETCEHASAYLT